MRQRGGGGGGGGEGIRKRAIKSVPVVIVSVCLGPKQFVAAAVVLKPDGYIRTHIS